MDLYLRIGSKETRSIAILSLLLVAGLFGVVAMAPSARAATVALTLTPNSGSGALGDVDTTFATATLVTVTGTGFPGGQDGIAVGYITLNAAISAANFNQLQLIRPSLLSSTTDTPATSSCPSTNGCVLADANGAFTAQFYVPEISTGSGTYQIVAEYTPTTGTTTSQQISPATSFTYNAAIGVDEFGNANTYNSEVDLLASGFQNGETVTIAPTTLFVTQQDGATGVTGIVVGTDGSTCSAENVNTGRCTSGTTFGQPGFVSQHKQATVTVTGTGGTSGDSAVTTFAVVPSIALLTYPGQKTTFSMSTAAGSAYIEGFNFGASTSGATITGNTLTITVGSTTASSIMNAVTTSSSGYFGPTQFTWTQALPEGLASITLNGTTFSWANANVQPEGDTPAVTATSSNFAFTTTTASGSGGSYFLSGAGIWQAPLIASTSSGPAFILTDKTSYAAGSTSGATVNGLEGAAWIFGVGFSADITTLASSSYTPTSGSAASITLGGGSGFTPSTFGSQYTDSNGAFMAEPCGPVVGGGAACNANEASTSNHELPESYGSSNILSATAGSATGTATITIAPSFVAPSSTQYLLSSGQSGQTPFNRLPRNTATRLEVTGFSESTNGYLVPDTQFTITLTSSTGVVSTWATIAGSTTACTLSSGTPVAPTTANTMCVGNANSGASPGDYVFNAGTVPELAGGSYTLTVTGQSSGNVDTFGTTVIPVVIGSALSVASGTPATTVAFATSTTSGGAGVHGLAPSTAYSVMFDGPTGTSVGTFTSTSNGEVPPGTQFALPAGATGTHVVDLVATGTTTSAIYGQIAPRTQSASQYTGYPTSSLPLTTGTSSNTGTQGLTIGLTGSGTLSPNVGSPGTVVTVAASGLTPNTAYYVVLYNNIAYASFTSTATGTVPSGVTFTFPNVPTSSTSARETGDPLGVYISSKALTSSGVAANATFILQSSLALSATTATPGQTLSLTARALASGQSYSVIFNYAVTSSGGSYTGITVGSLVGGTDGSATGQITVPASASSGSYPIQLIRTGTTGVPASLSVPPTLTVSSSPSGIGTTTLTPSGTASESVVSGTPTVSQSFTNTASGPLSVYMWVSVSNSAGQTVGVFLGSSTIAAGATSQIGAALFNLPSGTYTATVFCTTPAGVVISTTSTTTSFSV